MFMESSRTSGAMYLFAMIKKEENITFHKYLLQRKFTTTDRLKAKFKYLCEKGDKGKSASLRLSNQRPFSTKGTVSKQRGTSKGIGENK